MTLTETLVNIFKTLRPATALAVLSCYVIICRRLRYLRRNRKHAQLPYKTREDFSKMTAEHAWEICRYCMVLEFPFTSEKALQFALFRTYGIPTISKLLCDTKQLSEAKFAARRYADTGILITDFMTFHPTSDRANSAIARMNYLHGMYQRAGKISNDDMLYTLSLFVLEIERWVRLYEWRPLTSMEICAFGTLWKSIADAMGISFDSLAHGPSSFKDGLEFHEDLRLWSEGYEKREMVPNEWNHKLAEETTAILLGSLPSFMKPAGKQAVISLMDIRLRRAMLYDDPPTIYPRAVSSILNIRKFILQYLSPPRPYFLRYMYTSENADPKTGRYYQTVYESEPWYVQATFWARYEPSTWVRWVMGRAYPDGKNYKPEGYDLLEIGPQKMEKLGREECIATKEKLMSAGRGGCPFGFATS